MGTPGTLIGIEIGGTKLQIVRGTPAGIITERQRFQIDRQAGAAGIRRQIEIAIPQALQAGPAQAIGVGFGGPLDPDQGRIACSHQIEGWSDFPIAEWLRGLSGLPVAVENDANVATLGEAVLGAGKGRNPVFYVTLGSGVGGGLVVDGKIYHGMKPGEAEIGHLRLDRSGVIVEERCSGWATDRLIREAIRSAPDSPLARLIGEQFGGEARYLGPALQQGDPVAAGVINQVTSDLAFALSHVTHLFHPEVVVLGGGLSLVGEALRSGVARALPQFLMEVFHPGPEILLAGLGEDAVPVGALLLASRSTGRVH